MFHLESNPPTHCMLLILLFLKFQVRVGSTHYQAMDRLLVSRLILLLLVGLLVLTDDGLCDCPPASGMLMCLVLYLITLQVCI